jgi:hypothetical protein
MQYLVSLFSFPHLNLAIIFLLFYTLSPQVLRNFLCHTPGLFNSFPSFLLVTHFSGNISLSLFSPFFSFLSSIRLVSGTLPIDLFCLQTLRLSSPLSLCNLAFLCPLRAPFSNIFLAHSLLLLVP